jgi:hypothetical protein
LSSNQSRKKKSRQRDLPILPLAVGGVVVVVLAVLIFAYVRQGGGAAPTNSPGSTAATVANIPCDSGEHFDIHYHAHLTLTYQGQQTTIPAGVGIDPSVPCIHWLHTHATSGIIHIEAPASSASRKFTLGDFFAVWGQPLSSQQVGAYAISSPDQLRAWVNGQPYTGDPAKIVLESHTAVVLEVKPTSSSPPPAFNWHDPAVVQESGSS